MVKGATLVLIALAVTEAQAGVGSGEQERKRKTANQDSRFHYPRSHTTSFFVLSKRNTIVSHICDLNFPSSYTKKVKINK